MKLKSSYIYQLSDMRRAIAIFYFILLCVLVFGFTVSGAKFTISGNIISSTTESGFGGMEICSIIFLFVCGLNSFKEFFRMLMQNGISRRTLFLGRIMTILSVCAGMAVIDKIILLIGKLIASHSSRIGFTGLFDMIYAVRMDQVSGLQMQVDGFIFNMCLYLAAMTIGYFITIAFYRMSKIAKITVAVGVPMILLNVVPILDAMLLNGVIMKTLINTVSFAFGFKNGGNPYFGVVSLLLIAVVFCALSWLTMRKAVVRD